MIREAIIVDNDLDAAMIDCDNGLPPIFVIQPHETEQLAAARCSVSWGRKRVDSASRQCERVEISMRSQALGRAHDTSWGPRKVAKLCGERRGSRMNEFCRLRRNERYGACPNEVYKCALVTKGIIWLPPPRLVFSNTPALLNSLQCDTKSPCLRPPSWFSVPARCFP